MRRNVLKLSFSQKLPVFSVVQRLFCDSINIFVTYAGFLFQMRMYIDVITPRRVPPADNKFVSIEMFY